MSGERNWNRNDAAPGKREAGEEGPVGIERSVGAPVGRRQGVSDQPDDAVLVFDEAERPWIAEEQLDAVEIVPGACRSGHRIGLGCGLRGDECVQQVVIGVVLFVEEHHPVGRRTLEPCSS